MSGREWRDADAINCVRCVEVNRLDQREGGQVVMLSIQGGALIRRGCRIAHTHVILDQPFVDGLGGMGHEDPALEIRLAENIWKSGRVVDVEAIEQMKLLASCYGSFFG